MYWRLLTSHGFKGVWIGGRGEGLNETGGTGGGGFGLTRKYCHRPSSASSILMNENGNYLKGVRVSIRSGYKDKHNLKGVRVSIRTGYRDKHNLNRVIHIIIINFRSYPWTW